MTPEETGGMDLATLAQLVSDLYYQDFPGRDAFIGEEHIQPLIGMAYSRVLNEEFKVNKMMAKNITGFSFVELSSDWLVTEEVEFKKGTDDIISADLSKDLFFFDFDSLSSAVQSIRPVRGPEWDLVRVSINDQWKFKHLPPNDKVFYFVSGKNRIELLTKSGFPEKATVQYVPSVFPVDNNTTIPLSKAEEIAKDILQLLLTAKQGIVVDKTNNSNPNTVVQSEIDAESLKQ